MRSILFVLFALFLGGLCATHTSANQSFNKKGKAMVQAVSRLLNQIKSQDDEAALAQRSSLDQVAKLRMVLKQLLHQAKAQTSRGTILEAQDDKTALAQLYVHLLESQIQKQEDKAEIQSLTSDIRDTFSTLENKLKGGFKTFESKVKDLFQSIG